MVELFPEIDESSYIVPLGARTRDAATTAECVRSQLRQNVLDARAAGDLSVANNALDKLCKIDGHYAPKKHYHTGNPWGEVLEILPRSVGPPQYRGESEGPSETKHWRAAVIGLADRLVAAVFV